MRVIGLALLALVVCAAVVAADTDLKPKKNKKKSISKAGNKKQVKAANAKPKSVHVCDEHWKAVGDGLCCPANHPQLIDGTCYEECHSDSDDMVLGGWVGCRELCDGGYASSINSCAQGIKSHERKDHTRDGVHPKPQKKITSADAQLVSKCAKGTVEVVGGCCPKAQPKLIAGECYGGCDAGKEEIVVGRFVGCRAACADGFEQHINDCTKRGEDTVDRGDFPRHGVSLVECVFVPAPKHDDGCGQGYVRASKRYCCPTTEPILKDLLCYEKCKTGFEESGYGCRQLCKAGWSQSTLECGKGAKHYRRKGYERMPKPSKLRM